MSPSRVRWGILLILIGLVFLGNNLGYLSWWIWIDLLNLWPVLLIAIGLEIVVKKSKLNMLGYLSTALILAVFGWVILRGADLDEANNGTRSVSVASVKAQSGNTVASFDIQFDDGRLVLQSDTDESGGNLIRGESRGEDGMSIKADCEPPSCKVLIRPSKRSVGRLIHFNEGHTVWRCYIRPEVLTSYDLDLERVDLRLNAEDLRVDTISINAEHSDLVLKFGRNHPHVFANLTGSHTNVDLYFPDSVGIKLEGDFPVSSIQEQFQLTGRGGYLANDLYDLASMNVHVKSDLRSGKIRINRL